MKRCRLCVRVRVKQKRAYGAKWILYLPYNIIYNNNIISYERDIIVKNDFSACEMALSIISLLRRRRDRHKSTNAAQRWEGSFEFFFFSLIYLFSVFPRLLFLIPTAVPPQKMINNIIHILTAHWARLYGFYFPIAWRKLIILFVITLPNIMTIEHNRGRVLQNTRPGPALYYRVNNIKKK